MTGTRPPLFHLAIAEEWLAAQSAGVYERSTIGRSLVEEGFIHCSFAHQVAGVATRFYRGRTDIVLLRIEPDRVPAEIRIEDVEGTSMQFPHIYGPLPVDAVVSSRAVPVDAEGRHRLAGLLDG